MRALPEGLRLCEVCGQVRGTATVPDDEDGEPVEVTSLCLCDGLTCRRCGVGRIRRPVSDYYDPEDGEWWHTPYFGAMIPCAECSRREREGVGEADRESGTRDAAAGRAKDHRGEE